MKLIVTQWLSYQLPVGAAFEIPDTDALVLIEAGYARKDDGQEPEHPPMSRRTYRRRDLQAEP